MNQQQVRYVKSRAEAMYKEKQANLRAKFATKAVTLTGAQQHEALKAGAYKLKPLVGTPYYLRDFISFVGETQASFDQEGFEKALGGLTKSFNALMDEIMIGDNELAVKLLKEFEVS